MNKLDWLDDIDFEEILTGDMKLIAKQCGMDVLKSLLANLPSIHVYLSRRPLEDAARIYIEKHYNGSNAKDLAAILNVSEMFIYKCNKEAHKKRLKKAQHKQQTIFD